MLNQLSAYDLISRHAVAVMHSGQKIKTHHEVAQVSLKIYKFFFKFLKKWILSAEIFSVFIKWS